MTKFFIRFLSLVFSSIIYINCYGYYIEKFIGTSTLKFDKNDTYKDIQDVLSNLDRGIFKDVSFIDFHGLNDDVYELNFNLTKNIAGVYIYGHHLDYRLDAKPNKLDKITFNNPESLKYLHIEGTNLSDTFFITSDFKGLIKLKIVDNLNLTHISIANGLSNLEDINISENSLETFEFPDGLTKLEKFDISHNEFLATFSWPSNGLESVEVLEFTNTLFLPQTFTVPKNMTNLRRLSISGTNIISLSIPETCTKLTNISAFNNKFLAYISLHPCLSQLKDLTVDHNPLLLTLTVPYEIWEKKMDKKRANYVWDDFYFRFDRGLILRKYEACETSSPKNQEL